MSYLGIYLWKMKGIDLFENTEYDPGYFSSNTKENFKEL